MNGRSLEQLAAALGVPGAALALVVSVRFAWLAVQGATAPVPQPPESTAPPPRAAPVATETASAPADRPPAVPGGTPVRMSLVVDSEHGRAQVFVDGVPVGDTPFVGDVSCRAGKPVKVDIMPPKRVPVTREFECRRGARRVTDAE